MSARPPAGIASGGRDRPECRPAVRRPVEDQRLRGPVRDSDIARVIDRGRLDHRIHRLDVRRPDRKSRRPLDDLVDLGRGMFEIDQREREVVGAQVGLRDALVTAVHVADRRLPDSRNGLVRMPHHDEVGGRLQRESLGEPREVFARQVGRCRAFGVVAATQRGRPAGEQVGEVPLRVVHGRRPAVRQDDRLRDGQMRLPADVVEHRRHDVVAPPEPQVEQLLGRKLPAIDPGIAHVGPVCDRLARLELVGAAGQAVGDRPRDEMPDRQRAAPGRLRVRRVEHAPVMAVRDDGARPVGGASPDQRRLDDQLDRLASRDVAAERRVQLGDLERADRPVMVPGHEDDVAGQRFHELGERAGRSEQRRRSSRGSRPSPAAAPTAGTSRRRTCRRGRRRRECARRARPSAAPPSGTRRGRTAGTSRSGAPLPMWMSLKTTACVRPAIVRRSRRLPTSARRRRRARTSRTPSSLSRRLPSHCSSRPGPSSCRRDPRS